MAEINNEDEIRKIPEYEGDYIQIDKDRLVLYSVDYLITKKIEPTFDKVVVTTFKLFPKKFSLLGFPEYPDAKTIYYCVFNHCTITRKWLVGNVQSAFALSDKGTYFLDETKKMLEGKLKSKKTYDINPRRKEVTFVSMLKKTSAFSKYADGKSIDINETDIFEAAKAPPNSVKLAKTHIEKYREYASRLNEKLVLDFLDYIDKKLGGGKNE